MTSPQRCTFLCAWVLVASNAAGADDSESVSHFLQNWADAWRTADVNKMMAFYNSADDTMAIESLGRVRHGPREIRKMYKMAFDELAFERVTLTPITQHQHDSVTWAVCHYQAEIRLKSDNSKYVLEARGSFVMKRHDGSWRIALEHFSTIPEVPRVRPADE